MKPFSQATITALQGMTAEMLTDEVEINPVLEGNDGYGNFAQSAPSTGVTCRGSLQEIVRIPGTPEQGSSAVIVGNFLLKLEAGAPLPERAQKCRFVVNGGDTYEAENVYRDKSNKLTISVYCYRVK